MSPNGSNILPEASSAICIRIIPLAETMLQCSGPLKFVRVDAPKLFDATHLENKTIATSRTTNTVLLFRADKTNQKGVLLFTHFTRLDPTAAVRRSAFLGGSKPLLVLVYLVWV